MISTITTSTVTSAAIAGSLVSIGILLLLSLLVQKELVGASTGEQAQRIGQALDIAIAPLLIVFVLVVITKIAEVIR